MAHHEVHPRLMATPTSTNMVLEHMAPLAEALLLTAGNDVAETKGLLAFPCWYGM